MAMDKGSAKMRGDEETFASLQARFDDLPQDATSNIVSRLTVVENMRSRLVSKSWKSISGSRFPWSGNSADFVKNIWVRNRPMERWLFLHNDRFLHGNVVYDVQHNKCYKLRLDPELNLARQSLTVWNTTTNGLVFLQSLEMDTSAIAKFKHALDLITSRVILSQDTEVSDSRWKRPSPGPKR